MSWWLCLGLFQKAVISWSLAKMTGNHLKSRSKIWYVYWVIFIYSHLVLLPFRALQIFLVTNNDKISKWPSNLPHCTNLNKTSLSDIILLAKISLSGFINPWNTLYFFISFIPFISLYSHFVSRVDGNHSIPCILFHGYNKWTLIDTNIWSIHLHRSRIRLHLTYKTTFLMKQKIKLVILLPSMSSTKVYKLRPSWGYFGLDWGITQIRTHVLHTCKFHHQVYLRQ